MRPASRHNPILPVKVWITWVGLVHALFAYFAWQHQDFLAFGDAYRLAVQFVPFEVWAVVSAVIAVLVALSTLKEDLFIAYIALGLALPTQVMFGLSIGALIFQDPSIITAPLGTMQWFTMAVGNIVVLWTGSVYSLSDAGSWANDCAAEIAEHERLAGRG